MAESIQLAAEVPESMRGQRLDQAAAQLFPDYSRGQLQNWIKSGELLLDEAKARPKDKVNGGEQLSLQAEVEDEARWEPEPIDLDIVYEDESIMVINKPAGLVVHPAAGNPSGTLLNAVLHHCPDLASVPRAGIVHRLDKDTTGLMVVAKTLAAQTSLVGQLQDRSMSREYEAICSGVMTGGGMVDAPIGRHATQRVKMAVPPIGGKDAVTHYRVIKRFAHFTHIQCKLETGRTHQIRVHMAHIKYPLVGDALYAGRPKIPPAASELLLNNLQQFKRQALHARSLGLYHPETDEYIEWEEPLPEDMLHLLEVLNSENKA